VVPFVAGDGPPPPALPPHSATSTTRGFEGHLTDVQAGRQPYDVPGHLKANQRSSGSSSVARFKILQVECPSKILL
jgi:hypothetical protein